MRHLFPGTRPPATWGWGPGELEHTQVTPCSPGVPSPGDNLWAPARKCRDRGSQWAGWGEAQRLLRAVELRGQRWREEGDPAAQELRCPPLWLSVVLDRGLTLGGGPGRERPPWAKSHLGGAELPAAGPPTSQSGPTLLSTCPPSWTLEGKQAEAKVRWRWKPLMV